MKNQEAALLFLLAFEQEVVELRAISHAQFFHTVPFIIVHAVEKLEKKIGLFTQMVRLLDGWTDQK